jgi:hypothetical protein
LGGSEVMFNSLPILSNKLVHLHLPRAEPSVPMQALQIRFPPRSTTV